MADGADVETEPANHDKEVAVLTPDQAEPALVVTGMGEPAHLCSFLHLDQLQDGLWVTPHPAWCCFWYFLVLFKLDTKLIRFA